MTTISLSLLLITINFDGAALIPIMVVELW